MPANPMTPGVVEASMTLDHPQLPPCCGRVCDPEDHEHGRGKKHPGSLSDSDSISDTSGNKGLETMDAQTAAKWKPSITSGRSGEGWKV